MKRSDSDSLVMLTVSHDIESVYSQIKSLLSTNSDDRMIPIFVIDKDDDDLSKSKLLCEIALSNLILTIDGVQDMCHKLLLITNNNKRVMDLEINYKKFKTAKVESIHAYLIKNIR